VQNFENQNPANTLWTKQYNLYSKIDTEASRYLGFERWWGGHVNLNAEEIQFILDELFIGNNLAAGKIQTSDGTAIDLRNIRSPIVAFCSKGDNVTPPQQALGWILDLYDDVDEIRSYGQTIVYTVHERIGHLGIFVSGGVAKKEHGEFSSNIDLIDTLPPGLYEAVFEAKTGDTINPDLATGNWVMRCEARTLDDIRALGGNDAADERRFATAARVSETNLALYRTFAQPMVRMLANSPMAEWLQRLHPLRLQYEMFSNANPMMAPVAALAGQVRKDRRSVSADNPFVTLQENVSGQIVAALDVWREATEAAAERTFLAVYGLPSLQAAVGVDPGGTSPLRKAAKSPLHRELLQTRIAELKSRIPLGGVREAVVRALIYGGTGRASVDERGFETVRRLRRAHGDIPLSVFKALVREQFNMLLVDEKAALAAIASMLPPDAETRATAFELVKQALGARGAFSAEDQRRMTELARLFGVDAGAAGPPNLALVPPAGTHAQAKAS
jgi:Protein of unknown function (DUF3141)